MVTCNRKTVLIGIMEGIISVSVGKICILNTGITDYLKYIM
jgi:hypothetical protein